MTFRTRLLLIFTVSVVASVGLVEWLVLANTRQAFERTEAQRVDALVGQFRKEFDRRRDEIARAVNRIAESDAAVNIAIAPDYAPYYNEAGALAATHGLDVLDLVAEDGTIISSAEWPARFGYKEDWLKEVSDWGSRGAVLRRQELPGGMTLALTAVRVVTAGDRRMYVAGGQELDPEFVSKLVLPAGMRVLLWRDLGAGQTTGTVELEELIDRVRARKTEQTATVGSGVNAETFHALPLTGYDGSLLAVLLVGSSRRDLVELEALLRTIGIGVALSGMLLGIGLAWWATARVTRPVQQLAESAGKVAAGNWSATVEVASGDEIGQLARAFNRMTHELVEQRERLVQAERVAAWRELARRLAHELKNPLFPLQITVENMQRARESYPEQFDEVFREGTATLLAELANLKQIIGRFSDFARMPAPEMQPVHFNDLVAENLKLFEAQLEKAGVRAVAELDGNLKPVQADPEQMSRVLRNLILNAIDAMPQGGTLAVRTAALGGGVRIEIADTGQGLTPEECARLFTPYYTTKTHGTGLGLAIVQSVVSDHGGRISVESAPGQGSVFRIELG
jgi:two-component system, NtrC family, nitrogen regulation sensor histidine kinase NtrY